MMCRHYTQFVVSVERPTIQEDYIDKYDALMFTLLSKQLIPIQIKSSIGMAHQFISQGRPVPVVVVHPNDTREQIRRRTIFEITNMFPYLGEEIKEMGCELPRLINYYQKF